jgi:hypothetical protein
MSRYTTEVRWICGTDSGFPIEDLKEGKYTVDEIIRASRKKVIDFTYPIFDESHREDLEVKILKHYYTREIGAETVGLWKLWFNDKMNLIMPKYNQLYKAEFENYEKMMNNVDVKIDRNRDTDLTRTDVTTDKGNVTSDGWQQIAPVDTVDRIAFSDTPQGGISNVENNSYLTNYTKNTGEVVHDGRDTDHKSTDHDNTNKLNGHSVEDMDELMHEYGYRGGKTYFELMADYAEKVVNIDEMIINELSDLFMLIW